MLFTLFLHSFYTLFTRFLHAFNKIKKIKNPTYPFENYIYRKSQKCVKSMSESVLTLLVLHGVSVPPLGSRAYHRSLTFSAIFYVPIAKKCFGDCKLYDTTIYPASNNKVSFVAFVDLRYYLRVSWLLAHGQLIKSFSSCLLSSTKQYCCDRN